MLFVTSTTVTKFFILLLFFVLGLKTRLKSSCNETNVLSLNGLIETREVWGPGCWRLFSKGLPVYYTGRQEKYSCVYEIISVYWSWRGPKGYVLRLNGKPRITIAVALFGWNYRSFLSIYISKRQKEKNAEFLLHIAMSVNFMNCENAVP